MSENEIEEVLRETGFLQNVAGEHLTRLAQIAELVEYPEGKLILRDGDEATKIYVILSGKVSIEICAPGVGCRRIMTLTDGDLMSWSAMLEHHHSTASARCLTPVKAVAIDGRQLLALCEHDPALGYALMRRVALAIAQRLTFTRMQLIDVFGTTMPTAPSTESNVTSSETAEDE